MLRSQVMRLPSLIARNALPVSLFASVRSAAPGTRMARRRVLSSVASPTNRNYIEPSNPLVIHSCSVLSSNEMLELTWNSGVKVRFPLAFLRDNCPCPTCWNPTFRERKIHYWCVSDVGIECTDMVTDGGHVTVTWNDGHRSEFSAEFMAQYTLPAEEHLIEGYSKIYNRETLKAIEDMPRFNYVSVMKDDSVLLSYIQSSLKYGIAMMEDVPKSADEVENFGKRIAYLRESQYGPTFHVRTTSDASSVAYSAVPLALHSDQTDLAYSPEILVLHCLEQSTFGGESELVDAMAVAYQLKESNRRAYDVLTKVHARFEDIGEDKTGKFHLETDQTVIAEDKYGDIDKVRINDYHRGIYVNSTPEMVLQWYKAYDEFKHNIRRKVMTYKLQEGEMLTLDNRRMLHGRKGHPGQPTSRWLNGAYIGMDEYLSRMRCLQDAVQREQSL